jgi:myosin heavy subunit
LQYKKYERVKDLSDIVLSQDLNVITAEINSYKQVAGQAIFEIGRRLKHVKENDLVHGEWENWLKSNVSFTNRQARRFIQTFEEFKTDDVVRFGSSKIFEMLSLPTDIDREEFTSHSHTIPSTGETKTVDGMTVRELREVKVALKQAEEERDQLGQLLQQERSKPPKVETKVVEKVVDNTDHNKINQLQQQLDKVDQQKRLLEQKVKLEEKDAAEYRKLKEEIQRLHSEKDNLHRQIESATSLSRLYVQIEDLLQNKLAPVKYSRALTERRDSKVVMNNLKGIIHMVEDWLGEIKTYLPNENKNYIDAEVIEYE